MKVFKMLYTWLLMIILSALLPILSIKYNVNLTMEKR
jgi:hypothetical protein